MLVHLILFLEKADTAFAKQLLSEKAKRPAQEPTAEAEA